ncbi:hypothetical protein CDL12_22218 [Handroanthus impetiginosus]|uniref:Uncharacterized protein n=1 Tax=Handroanthus impetiginosus TaxID=429701 RepID=A0A2G9GJ72_9LAMI|nr:hypothetical protein CDL12_22218 [Handroanthus impetiginosus]
MEDQIGNLLANIFKNEVGFFQTSQIIWDPLDPFFLNEFPGSVFSHRQLFVYEKILKGFSTTTIKIKKEKREEDKLLKESYFELLISRYR